MKTKQVIHNKNYQLLIDGTLTSISKVGLVGTTVSNIAKCTGLSRGMICLHFGSKDNLIFEAARHSSKIYHDTLREMVLEETRSNGDQVAFLIRCNLDKKLLNKRKASIWHSLRRDIKGLPKVAKFADSRDVELTKLFFDPLNKIANLYGGEQNHSIENITYGIITMLDGMWGDYLSRPHSFNRENAANVIFEFLSGLFPAHFESTGAVNLG